MPKFKVTSRLNHDGVVYDVEGNAEGLPSEVEFAQDLAERCGAVDPTPLLTPAEVAAAAKQAAEEAQAAADAAKAAEEAQTAADAALRQAQDEGKTKKAKGE